MQVVYRSHPKEGQKKRPDWYSPWKCLQNLIQVFGGGRHQWHFIIDGGDHLFASQVEEFAVNRGIHPCVLEINENHNARAFRRMLDYVEPLGGILYLVENDYLHLPNADVVLEEGFQGCGHYVTCYDHRDKYPPCGSTRLHLGQRCHYRETPSTTCTFAVNAETLRKDRLIWESHCSEMPDWIHDNEAFAELTTGRQARTVVSSVPAFSTHCEEKWLAPLIDWEEVNRR